MKKIFKVLLVVMLFFGLIGCDKDKNQIKKELKTTELGDILIERYSEVPQITSVDRDYLPDEIYNLGQDYIVFKGAYESGATSGFAVIVSKDNLDKVYDYAIKLANKTYKDLQEDTYGISKVLYNDSIPITVSISKIEFENDIFVITYEAIEMSYSDTVSEAG